MPTPSEAHRAELQQYLDTANESHEWCLDSLSRGEDPQEVIRRHREVVRNAWAAYVKAVPEWARR